MTSETILTIPDLQVMFVAGERGRPISEQAPAAFRELEAELASLKGRRFYGALVGDEYRACVSILPADNPQALPHATWVLPGGRYARRRIPDWEANLSLIAPTFEELRRRGDFDSSRPCIEYYRSQKELLVMVPVR